LWSPYEALVGAPFDNVDFENRAKLITSIKHVPFTSHEPQQSVNHDIVKWGNEELDKALQNAHTGHDVHSRQ